MSYELIKYIYDLNSPHIRYIYLYNLCMHLPYIQDRSSHNFYRASDIFDGSVLLFFKAKGNGESQ